MDCGASRRPNPRPLAASLPTSTIFSSLFYFFYHISPISKANIGHGFSGGCCDVLITELEKRNPLLGSPSAPRRLLRRGAKSSTPTRAFVRSALRVYITVYVSFTWAKKEMKEARECDENVKQINAAYS